MYRCSQFRYDLVVFLVKTLTDLRVKIRARVHLVEILLINASLEIGLENRFFPPVFLLPSLPPAAIPNDFCHL